MDSFILYGFLPVQPLITVSYRIFADLPISHSYRFSPGGLDWSHLRTSNDHRFTVGVP